MRFFKLFINDNTDPNLTKEYEIGRIIKEIRGKGAPRFNTKKNTSKSFQHFVTIN